MKKEYLLFLQEARGFLPQERIYTDELRLLAWGTDAGFYRLMPQVVIRACNEEEVARLLTLAHRYRLPVTFRAAGTSLSGQAISDSILIVAGKHWEHYEMSADYETITLEPGITGQRVNELLAPHGRRFAPDPASVRSAMVGGIVMNNASGMNCGTHANSDKMLLSARIVLADGTVLDTGDPISRASFQATHPDFLERICELRDRVCADQHLRERILRKYSIKNVMGLNLLPLVCYEDPFDIIAHLMVGSEGTLAFLSRVTMRTEPEYPCKASAMLYFKTLRDACRAVVAMKELKDEAGEWMVKGAELLDYKSLSAVSDPVFLRRKEEVTSSPQGNASPGDERGLTAVLTETKAHTPEQLERYMETIGLVLKEFDTYEPVRFTTKPEEYARYWAIRSGIFPSVGGTRRPGTTCLIEDVAFHIEDLPDATEELQQLIARHGYEDACIYGHALEGNYHFILNQSFHEEKEVRRYEALMEDVKTLVVDRYDGSLKAEHGTGRNMAPYVRYEWGDDAYEVMRQLKELFDPAGLLNPGVIFNDDPRCHLKNFKPLPLLDEKLYARANKCIECGFCEINCLSCGFTLSSRQRIVVQRELARLRRTGEDPARLARLEKQYHYPGEQTCAGDGLCSTSCTMGINVGELTHELRQLQLPPGSTGYRTGAFAARHFAPLKSCLRVLLRVADFSHALLGSRVMEGVAKGLHKIPGIPLWTPAMPKAYTIDKKQQRKRMAPDMPLPASEAQVDKVVYFPSCINQTMGLARKSPVGQPLVNKMVELIEKAGMEVIFPQEMEKLCCGTIWESKGMPDIADRKAAELEAALWEASQGGHYPVLCDQSPCLHRMRQTIKSLRLYEPVEFISTILAPRLSFRKTDRPVAVHITCSMREMGLADMLVALARRCSSHVLVPEEIGCCGFAGDRGFTHPEVNAYALRKLRPQIEAAGVQIGYCNSRTCEIGLATHTGIPYVSIAYLVDECTTPLPQEEKNREENKP